VTGCFCSTGIPRLRAFFALPAENFSTTTGQPTNAVYGFTAMLINVLRDERPTHVAVAFDRSEPTFRHEPVRRVQGEQAGDPGDFRGQLTLIFEVRDRARDPAAVAGRATRLTTSSRRWPPRARPTAWAC